MLTSIFSYIAISNLIYHLNIRLHHIKKHVSLGSRAPASSLCIICSSRSKANIQREQQTHFLLFSLPRLFRGCRRDAAQILSYMFCIVHTFIYMYTVQRGWADVSTLRQQTLFPAERWKEDRPIYVLYTLNPFFLSFLFCFSTESVFDPLHSSFFFLSLQDLSRTGLSTFF